MTGVISTLACTNSACATLFQSVTLPQHKVHWCLIHIDDEVQMAVWFAHQRTHLKCKVGLGLGLGFCLHALRASLRDISACTINAFMLYNKP